MDLERVLESIELGQQDRVQRELDLYNEENAQCFFFNAEERERRKQQELEEFRRNKFRDHVPNTDSDYDSDHSDDPDLKLRQRLAEALMGFLRKELQPCCLASCLRTVRILSRDRLVLGPLSTAHGLSMLARLAGIQNCGGEREGDSLESERRGLRELGDNGEREEEREKAGACGAEEEEDGKGKRNRGVRAAFAWGKGKDAGEGERHGEKDGKRWREGEKDRGGEGDQGSDQGQGGQRDGGREGERDDEEDSRMEAMKALCNVIYHSQGAQEHACRLRLLSAVTGRVKRESVGLGGQGEKAPPPGQFYDLRLLFLLTALRPELRGQLAREERGVSVLVGALERALYARWGESYEVLGDPKAPPLPQKDWQLVVEILKVLFNIVHTVQQGAVDEENEALYRHLAALLRHCLLLNCEGEDRKEELQGHTVNVLSALPLSCLDVLVSVRLGPGSVEYLGINMDCVEALLGFMERRLERGEKLRERLTPVLNLLTESSRVHRETRRYLRSKILPPLREVLCRPEQGSGLRGQLVRLMTHLHTDLKHCAAELLFVLCKENVSRFVKYTGYGNAAGLLAARGLLAGAGAGGSRCYSSDSDSDTEEYRAARARINPVTGRVEEETPDPMEGMSEEEREEEARRLVCMLNRLARDQIIEPMGMMTDGRLRPLGGEGSNCNDTMTEEPEEPDNQSERDSD